MANSERIRVAQTLHDGIAQDLIAMGYSLDLLLAEPTTELTTRRDLRMIRFQIDELVSKIRDEIYQLRRNVDGNFSEILKDFAEKICGERLHSCDIAEVSPEKSDVILAIAKELLRNAIKHSGGNEIDLIFTSIQNRYLLEISDNGKGGAQVKNDRYGLQGVRELASEIGAEFSMISTDRGTKVSLAL